VSAARRGVALALVVLLGLAVIAGLLALLQGPERVLPGFGAFFAGIAGNQTSLAATARYMTPILLIAVSAGISVRAGLFDVGQVGQFLAGGMAAAAVGAGVPAPGPVRAVLALCAGMLVAGLWAWIIGYLSAETGIVLVVVSLIGNYFAEGLVRLLARTLLQDPGAFSVIATRQIPQDAWLPILVPRTSLHLGFLLAVAVAVIVWVVVRTTEAGHRLTMYGRNPRFAAIVGVDPRRYPLRVLLVSGSITGLAGAVEVLGVYHRFQDGTLGGPSSIAWTGLTAAIIVPAGLLVMVPVSLFLAALTTGLAGVQREIGITSGLGTLVQGLLIVVAAVALAERGASLRSRRRRAPVDDVEVTTEEGAPR
jgi:simple sugar transport system permease protein